uniref:Tubulin--tyrosine ligase-like protein 5 n=1 Tax=Timema monikensis TaxID=170555 RepID=A0A7R9E6U3_9NEOP|nr:unnamed protein product [Timema monikensis]
MSLISHPHARRCRFIDIFQVFLILRSRSFELTRKDRLYKNIEKMQHSKGIKHFDFIPQTFVMPMDFREFCSTHYRLRGPWIVKPVASSRGRGIYIVNSPDQVPLEDNIVVMKYVDNPLLIDGHKCDLRLYVAVTSYDPLMVYMYEEGLVRFAAVKYDMSGKHLWNPCMHLCNYSINKYHSDYVKSEDPDVEDVGHKWTLSALLRHLRAKGQDTSLLMTRIEEVVVKSVLASSPAIVSACRMFVPHTRNCFELYGFDILIDSSLKPWLLEVNLSPSLGCDSPLDVRVKSAMLADLLTLVGLPAVDPVLRRPGESHRPNTQSDMLKKLGCRRVQSADALAAPTSKKTSRLVSSTLALSPEVSRLVRTAQFEFERRGGFVRIFPSAESWKRYGNFLDPLTGVTSTSIIGGGGHFVSPLTSTPQNYNFLLHQQLFPELAEVPPHDRFTRYERALLRGHKASLNERSLSLSGGDTPDVSEDDQETRNLKIKILDYIQEGSRLSQHQARRIFAQYLGWILRNVSSGRQSETEEANSDLILRFLQKSSSNLRTPYFVQIPSRKLAGKDRIAVVAKQLNDFIYLYNRETELYTENSRDKANNVPARLFQRFLALASEGDLEDVLSVHTRLYKCAHLYLGRCGSTPVGSQPLGLLRTQPLVRDKGGCPAHRRPLPRLSKVPSVGGTSSAGSSKRHSHNKTLPGFEQCDELDAREWFESDGNDPGYQHLNDDKIVHQVIEDNDNGSNVRESDDDEEMDAEEAAGPSHSDAYEAFQTAMNWLERQPEGTATQLILLKRLRDMAAKKLIESTFENPDDLLIRMGPGLD